MISVTFNKKLRFAFSAFTVTSGLLSDKLRGVYEEQLQKPMQGISLHDGQAESLRCSKAT